MILFTRPLFRLSGIALVATLTACGGSDGADGDRGPAGPAPDVSVSSIAPGTECEQGGVRVAIGDADPFVVCNGEEGARGGDGSPGAPGSDGAPGEDGLTPAVTVEPIDAADEDSPCGDAGGVIVTVTVGDDTTTEYLCNGEDGQDGSDGVDGEDGLTPAVTVEPIDAADEDSPCGDAGGVIVTVSVGEDTSAEYVCNGADGTDGRDGASAIRVSGLDGAGEQCADVGGILVEVLDVDGEVESSWAVCNGATGDEGATGPAPSVSFDPATTEQCPDGGTVITIGEAEPFTLCNGTDGEPGATPNVTVETVAAGDEGCDNGGYALIVDTERYVLCIGGEPSDPTDPTDPTDPPVAIDWCAIVFPTDPVTIDVDDAFSAFAQIFIDGVTGIQSTERPDGYGAQMIFGPRDTDPRDEANEDDWFAINAELNPEFDQDSAENNDEVFVTLIWDIPGEFDFAFRVTTDAGETWTYCDTNGPDYVVENAGKLTAVPPSGEEPVVIAGWTFGSMLDGDWFGTPESLANEGTIANADRAIQVVGAEARDYVAGTEGSAANANGWDNGVGTKYWLVRVNAAGFQQLTISSWQRGSNTGPRDFDLEVSLDGDDWTTITSVVVVNSPAGGVVDNEPLPAAFDDAGDVWIRWVVTSTDRVSGADPVLPAGTNRIDAIRVRGVPIGD
ncbi:MAG: hypothetical protein EA398_08635 [Deltaproteobacteria bacterium]|nr:MAG: hypothetical protein EA398_08635 [Deltaproteobacteria bacterium]